MKVNRKNFDEEGNLSPDILENLEELSPEEFARAAELQSQIISKDAKDFGPYWLEKVQGSLAQERQQSFSQKIQTYNQKVFEARKYLNASGQIYAKNYFSNPDLLDIKLSELWARYPSLQISFNLNIQELTQSNTRLLRGFVVWFYLQENLSKYIVYEIEEQLDHLTRTDGYPKNQKVLKEILIIRKIFHVLDRDLAIHFLYSIYRKENLDKWLQTAETLIRKYKIIKIPDIKVKEKVRRRGYRESHSNKHKSKDWRKEVMMSKEARTLEEIKNDIRRKQALLFERRLDAFLALEDSNLPLNRRKEIFNSLLDPIEEETVTNLSENSENPLIASTTN